VAIYPMGLVMWGLFERWRNDRGFFAFLIFCYCAFCKMVASRGGSIFLIYLST